MINCYLLVSHQIASCSPVFILLHHHRAESSLVEKHSVDDMGKIETTVLAEAVVVVEKGFYTTDDVTTGTNVVPHYIFLNDISEVVHIVH